jgi:hypothetical protein
VWKTGNGGVSWENVSDGYFGGSIGAVAVSEWDPNVIYVGTGEKTVRGNVSPGNGCGNPSMPGETWQRAGLEDSQHISRIRIHPRNPDVAYAAVMGHLFGPNERARRVPHDGWRQTWERVKFVSDEVGAVDLVMDPNNPRILYASFWRVKRTPYSLESGGPGSGLYKSVGRRRQLDRTHGQRGPAHGYPRYHRRHRLTDQQPQRLRHHRGGRRRRVPLPRRRCKTWEKTNDERKLRQRAWYYTRIVADPEERRRRVRTQRALPSLARRRQELHHDPDAARRQPRPVDRSQSDPMRMIQSNDGGANISSNGGETWSTQANQPTVQFYRVSTDNDFPYRLLGGQQDNSAVRIRSQSAQGDAIGVRDWEPTAGGESGHISAKPDNPDIVVGGSYGGYLELVDHSTGARRAWTCGPTTRWATAPVTCATASSGTIR